MKMNKAIAQHLNQHGIYKLESDIKFAMKVCKPYTTEDFTDEELDTILSLMLKGAKSNVGTEVVRYFLKKYEDTVIQHLYDTVVQQDDFEYDDNYRVSDGSALEDFFFKIAEGYGCCGSYNGSIEYKGKVYKVGFNYGH